MANDSFHPWREAFFLEDPDCPTLVVLQQSKTTTKVFGPHSPGAARIEFALSSRVRAELRERLWGDPGRHFPSAEAGSRSAISLRASSI